jgi:hypothetical protein
MTDGQPASLSWCQAPISDPRPICSPSIFNYFLTDTDLVMWGALSDEKLGVYFSIFPRVVQLYPRALGSLYVVSYDSQGYGGGILTLPVYISFRNRMVQSKVKSQSHLTTDGQSITMSSCLVHSTLKGFHPNKFQSDIKRSTLRRRNLLKYHWEGCM